MSDPVDLSRLTVAVTGAARGIGLATVRAFAAAGACVLAGDVDEPALANAIRPSAGSVQPIGLDVTSRPSFAAFLDADKSAREEGAVDVLVNNAGVQHVGTVVDADETAARRQVEVNVFGTLNGMSLALERMLPRGRGQVINIASAAGRSVLPGNGVYSATKAAIIALSEAAHAEARGRGVHVSVLLPGLVDTEMASGTYRPRALSVLTPEAVAHAVLAVARRPRFETWVPVSTGWLFHLTAQLPRPVRDALIRALGIDRTLTDVDWSARSAYERRATLGAPGSITRPKANA